ncbi:MAG: molybdopterin-dependent oxidoreductase [Chloroflexi bacterium]|nr:molybdopterin-dependent oxidoreductase [Chloroflexota bacterium]
MTTDNRITLRIDDREVRARPGTVVLEAAIEAGIYIPYLCYHPGMKPYAACRMCMVQEEVEVEVERDGQKVKEKQLRPVSASCTMPVREGLVVRSANDALRNLQRGVMEMLLSEHPHGCLTCHRVELCGPEDICLRHVAVNDRCVFCPKNERCELKDSVRFLGMDLLSPLSYKTRGLELEAADPFYDRDYNLCIVCARCVRVCEEVRGDNAITFVERAGKALVGTSRGSSLLESGCEFCGACLDVCPVGALVEREHKWDKAVRVSRAVCPNCSVGCQLNLEVNRREKLIRAIPELNAPANRGQACYKGKFGLEFVNHQERLKRPLVRRDGLLQEATWEEALAYIAERMPAYRGAGFAALASARTSNEGAYLLQKFARAVMGSNSVDVDSNTRPALARALEQPLGYAAATNTLWELEQSGCILVVDANLTEEHNVAGVPIKRGVRKGARLIVIDTREVELTRYAHLWLRPRPGTTLSLLGGILREILESGLEDKEFLAAKVGGLVELWAALDPYTLEVVAEATGVPMAQIREAARTYADADSGAIVYALDNVAPLEQAAQVHALADLALATGNLGKPSSGLYPLVRGANAQGSADVGAAPDLLPGYQRTEDEAARSRLEERWGVRLPVEAGLGLAEALHAAASGSVKAMLLLGDSASYTSGELQDGYEALERLELLVVHDAFLGQAAQRAHVVLPATTFAEEEGTYTNLERRVQLSPRALSPRNSEARPAWQVLCQLAQRLGAKGFEFSSAAGVFDEVASVAPIYSGISHGRLVREAVYTLRPDPRNPLPTQLVHSDRVSRGLLWPCPDAVRAGAPVLYADGFPGGQARLMPLPEPSVLSATPGEFPFTFVPGRVLAQEERDVAVERVGGVNHIRRDERVEMHPMDATDLGLSAGDAVEVTAAGARLRGIVELRESQHRGVVSMTTLFGELATRLQASEDPDPMARVPLLSIRPARVEKGVR